MSAITFEGPFTKAEKPAVLPARRALPRAEEFRSALDRYLARYAAEQANRQAVAGGSNAGESRF